MGKLSPAELEKELQAIAATGLKEILILTGESRRHSGLEYIGEAVKMAAKYFSELNLEIYPLNTDEYRYLHECGADYVCVYQETYNPDRFSTRERPLFRDHVIGLVATKISAGVCVGVGGHLEKEKGDGQFEIADNRSVREIHQMIENRGLQPVYNDYIRV
ncbi:MAG TPA: hypothetical protein GXX46_11770 [Peptococcaceae bacterium]|nr:hypothetical protein [Peptococcaceae bacterium]